MCRYKTTISCLGQGCGDIYAFLTQVVSASSYVSIQVVNVIYEEM